MRTLPGIACTVVIVSAVGILNAEIPTKESTDGGQTWHEPRNDDYGYRVRNQPPPPPPPPSPEQIARQQANTSNEAGRKLYDAGDYQGAIAKFQGALKLQPNDPDITRNLQLARNELQKEREQQASERRTVALKEKTSALREKEEEKVRAQQQQQQQEHAADRAMQGIQFNGTGKAFIQLRQAAGEGNVATSGDATENQAADRASRPFDDRSDLNPPPLPYTSNLGGSILGTPVAQFREKVPPERRQEFDQKLTKRNELQAQYEAVDKKLLGGIEDAADRQAASTEATRLKSAVRVADIELESMVTVTLTPPKKKPVVPPPPVNGTP